jgi:hypothetical protein
MNTKNLSFKILAMSLLMLGAEQKVVARITFEQIRESEKIAEQVIKESLGARCKERGHSGCNKGALINTIQENLTFGQIPFVLEKDFNANKHCIKEKEDVITKANEAIEASADAHRDYSLHQIALDKEPHDFRVKHSEHLQHIIRAKFSLANAAIETAREATKMACKKTGNVTYNQQLYNMLIRGEYFEFNSTEHCTPN